MDVEIVSRIEKLKKELNAIILAHNYQPPQVQDIADFVGDSLELSIKAMQSNAKVIVFAGVDFMAEQAAVLNENSTVLHPEPDAKCPMASMISVEDVEKAVRKYPGAPVVMYVNSPAAVKALANYVVTSANAVNLVKALDSETIIFGPDKHLAEYVAEKTGKNVVAVPEHGHCPVHVKFSLEEITCLKSIYRNCVFIAHPECPRAVRSQADFVGSTSQMIEFVKRSSARTFLVGTEVGIIYRMAKEAREKVFIPASTKAICDDMKKITLEKILSSLVSKSYVMKIDRAVAEKVRKAIENTFDVLGVSRPWRK
ncbi:quinolinate synthase NadA [Ignisphaera sp. 4213-co]|uniref:Quinolinate synthase n=1 Tax=Ignisphaera cupida TaxID=3050454 RepID=A0ABD4ZB87_9CREN|nr:quinolinate synthase NadA [Ignisphaera sp. 4213-co]MDK6029363.1 quinolinate synthase NadA [Ignisphaera sp. 4213-co]